MPNAGSRGGQDDTWRVFDKLSVRLKRDAAFGAILLAVSLAGLHGATHSEVNRLRLVDQIQPAALALTNLEALVPRTAASMGRFLSRHEDSHRTRYQNENRALDAEQEGRRAALAALGDRAVIERLAALAEKHRSRLDMKVPQAMIRRFTTPSASRR